MHAAAVFAFCKIESWRINMQTRVDFHLVYYGEADLHSVQRMLLWMPSYEMAHARNMMQSEC